MCVFLGAELLLCEARVVASATLTGTRPRSELMSASSGVSSGVVFLPSCRPSGPHTHPPNQRAIQTCMTGLSERRSVAKCRCAPLVRPTGRLRAVGLRGLVVRVLCLVPRRRHVPLAGGWFAWHTTDRAPSGAPATAAGSCCESQRLLALGK
eukprot:2207960-Prymnesium_polylepis.2